MNIVSGASGSGTGTLTFSAFANTHPAERAATITVTAGPATATYAATELASADPLANREVRALYQKILNREPDSDGFAFWVGVATANPDGLGMMVDNFLTTPPAYEAMDRDFMVLAIYQALLGTPAGALSPVSYSDWSSAVNQFLSVPQICAGHYCGYQVAGNTLINTLMNSSTVASELSSVVIPSCVGIAPSTAASLVTILYQNIFGAPPSCTQLTNGIGSFGYEYSSSTGQTTLTGVINLLLDSIWGAPVVPPPVAPTTLSFASQSGQTNSIVPAPVTINVPGAWTASMDSATAAWIVVSPAAGTGPGSATVSVYPGGLPAGTYTRAIHFNSSGGSQTVNVTLFISSGGPVIYTDSPVLLAPDCCLPIHPIQVLTSDGSQVPFTVSASTPGITILGGTGVTPGSFAVVANSNYVDAGTSYGSIYITSPNMANSPQAVPVEVAVSQGNHVFTNPAFQNTTNGLFTDLLYFTILGRDPDAGGFNFWLNVANSGGPGVYFIPTTGNPPQIRLEMEGTGVPNHGFVGSPEFLGLFK